LVKLAVDLGLEKCIFLDYIENTELYKYYALADVFVLSSITTPMFKEPWGLVINEAMNQGCPVVATDAVGAAVGGLVDDGVNGFVVPERNSEKLAEAILKIFQNPQLAESMGKSGREKIEKWDYEHQAQGFVDAIQYCSGNYVH
jgi:glycosyltransferase involved in cell wall biosynthesis